MRSFSVLGRLIYLGVAYVWDCGPFRKRQQAGLLRFAKRLRAVMLELGGVYVKLGQLLSTRPDLVQPALAEELEALLDECPPEPRQDTEKTIQEELGGADGDLPFELLDELNSASFGCVYRVRLHSGELAAIKVQRRGIDLRSRKDLKLLMRLASILDFLAVANRYRLVDWIKELDRWTSEELDYLLEARKMTYVATNIRRIGGVKIPEVIWQVTTRRILAMEYLEGRWLSKDVDSLSDTQLSHAAALLFQCFLFQIFELGFFHADLHKGNLCILADGTIGMVDFGITGTASPRTRQRHLTLVAAVQKGAVDDAFSAILEICFVPPDTDVQVFKQDFEREYYDWFLRSMQPGFPASHRGSGALMLAVFRRAYEHSIVVDSDVVRYYRAFSIIDGVVNSLDPSFPLADALEFYLKSRLRRQIEDLIDRPYDPIGALVAFSTEVMFRSSEIRRALHSTTSSVHTAVARLRLVAGSIGRKLSRLAWMAAIFALIVDLLVRTNVLRGRAVLIETELSGRIHFGDIAAVLVPMIILAVALGWFGRVLRARAYTATQPDGPAISTRRRRRISTGAR
jgi:ubiquinone biosynthesis protein